MAMNKQAYIELGQADAKANKPRATTFTAKSWQEIAYNAGYQAVASEKTVAEHKPAQQSKLQAVQSHVRFLVAQSKTSQGARSQRLAQKAAHLQTKWAINA